MIVESAAPLFAINGFSGTTTKQIAKAAGVSEALLYKHFPSKEVLYQEMLGSACSAKQELVDAIMLLPSNTDTLIISIYYFFEHILYEEEQGKGEKRMVKRLMLNSLLEDGHFAKIFLEHRFYPVIEKFESCITEAIRVGDIREGCVPIKLGIWMGHHIATAIGFMRLPGNDLVDYGCSKEELLIHSVRFGLRGLGLSEEIIRARVRPEYLAQKLAEYRAQIKED